MKAKKHDTRWMVSVALMAAIIIVLANTPLGMIQLPVIKATTVHIPVIIGAILLGPSAGAILGGVFGICSLISNTFVFCIFAVYEYDRNSGSTEGNLDFRRLQDLDRSCVRMALAPAEETEGQSDHCPSYCRVHRIHGEHDNGYGKYLSSVCQAVC